MEKILTYLSLMLGCLIILLGQEGFAQKVGKDTLKVTESDHREAEALLTKERQVAMERKALEAV